MSVPITVLGGGVAGLVMATELSERGFHCHLHDPNGAPGPHHCSWWAGGMLAPWCEGESAPAVVESEGERAITWWARHTTSVQHAGTLVLCDARERGELARFARRSRRHQSVDGAAISALEPDLAGRFERGLFFPDEAHLTPRIALSELRAALAQRGVLTAPSAPVQEPLTIDCRGLSARDALRDLRGVRGETVILRCPDLNFSRPIRWLHPRIPLYIVPRGEGVFMLGATMVESASKAGVSARAALDLLSAAWNLHPAFAEAEILELGADVRPAFPDNLPRLRRKSRVIYANGLYRHGFLLSPSLARMTADHLETGTLPAFMDEVVL